MLVLDDIGADAIKTGMLHKASVIEAVADAISSPSRGGGRRGAQQKKAFPKKAPTLTLPLMGREYL